MPTHRAPRELTALLANSGKTSETIAAQAGVNLSDVHATLGGRPVDQTTTDAIAAALGMNGSTLARLIDETTDEQAA